MPNNNHAFPVSWALQENRTKARSQLLFQVQGTLTIAKRKWRDFVVWTPWAIYVQCIAANLIFWEKHKPKLVHFYKEAILLA